MNIKSISSVSQGNSVFQGVKPEVARNQMKILLTQDIWAPSLKVKMPETELEKEVLLEILEQRAKLDRFVRLTNEKFKTNALISYIIRLNESNPDSSELPMLMDEVQKKGNLESYFKTLNKNIELERNKKKPALEYFQNIHQLENEYEEKKLVKNSMLNKFWQKVSKNNINPDGNLSTKELIQIVSDDKKVEPVRVSKIVVPNVSKKQFLANIQLQYEGMLREGVDVFMGQGMHNTVASNARKTLESENIETIRRFPQIEKQLIRLYEAVERKFTFKVDRLDGIDIYPLGVIWKDMIADEAAMRSLVKEISNIRAKLEQTPADKTLVEQLKLKEKDLIELKGNWLARLECSIKYQGQNREIMIKADRLPEYEYLTAENKTMHKHQKLYDAYKSNDNILPEQMWEEVMQPV